jgi:DNA processing protein
MKIAGSQTGIALSDKQRFNWLRLIRTENVGPATFRDLINQCGSAETALEMLPELSRRGGAKKIPRIPSKSEIEDELKRCENAGARFIATGEPDFPTILRNADPAPPLLAVTGDASVFALPPVAIVGARNASLAGIKFAERLAADLGGNGFCIVSGLARGIDTAAHRGSLSSGTIAVLAGGLDKIYPPENISLFQAIRDNGGAIVSEMPFGWTARSRDFPRRNRIVAGLSLGLVVVEAAKRSGSLISARLAGEMGRLVFAVPGSPMDPRAGGTNVLIKNGALVVTEASDIIDAIRPLTGDIPTVTESLEEPPDFSTVPPPDEPDRDLVCSALGPVPVLIDDLIDHTGLHPSQVHLILLELDLAGRLERHSGSAVSLLPADLF